MYLLHRPRLQITTSTCRTRRRTSSTSRRWSKCPGSECQDQSSGWTSGRRARRGCWRCSNPRPTARNAIRFLQLLLAPGGIGQTTLQKVGPSPVGPAVV